MTVNERIKALEDQIKYLNAQILDLTSNRDTGYQSPTTVLGKNKDISLIRPIDPKSGLGRIYGNSLVWNTSEIGNPPLNAEPVNPEMVEGAKGYNKHSHSRFSGGALIKDVLEIVEYVWGSITNKHSQAYWNPEPQIKTYLNSKGEVVEAIGNLDLTFNPDVKKFGVAAYEIDVNKCYLVMRDENGDIMLDENGNEMKSPLYNEDVTKTSVVWDINGQCFRFYAAYAPGV